MKKIIPKELIVRYDEEGEIIDSVLTYRVFEKGKLLFDHRSISVKSIVQKSREPKIKVDGYKKFAEEKENEM